MIKITCDKCGKDCGRVAYDFLIRLLHNPTPMSIDDIGEPTISHDKSHYRAVLCQECYRELGFPNIYKVVRTKNLDWSGDDA